MEVSYFFRKVKDILTNSQCSVCMLFRCDKETLTLQLDHINGNIYDN